jgi:tripartite-type tricarboxylate transporter receptor subunit TctC
LGINLLGSLAYAAYPDKPVKFVVSFAPGGPVDIAARIVGARLSETLKQSVIIDNKTGAGGNVAAQLIAKAPSDGYTFLLTSSAYAVNPSLYGEKAGYNPSKNFGRFKNDDYKRKNGVLISRQWHNTAPYV